MLSVTLEYIWLDGTTPTQKLRSKTKIVFVDTDEFVDDDGTVMFELEDCPAWGFDGSSTEQADGHSSDRYLKPVYLVENPLREHGFLVMCEVMMPDGVTPHVSNTRAKLRSVMDHVPATEEPWFGLEQEYFLYEDGYPIGTCEPGVPTPGKIPVDQIKQGQYYCAVGAENVFGRSIMESHMNACLNAGIHIAGTNSEVSIGQFEFQLGVLDPLSMGDELWISRWLLQRIAETYNVSVVLDAKPYQHLNGSGCHSNFSTKAMRTKDPGMAAITAWCEAARGRTHEHISAYGHDIESRLTGQHETCSYREFKYGVSDRTASIRIPLQTANEGYGYLEDRRPNSNANPYDVCRVMLETLLAAGAEKSFD